MSALSFADFVLDLDARELRRGSRAVSLSPKAYELLEMLVVNRPRAVSKSALQERLWPNTYVVEKNLVNLVAEIREALGDDATHPRFVKTVRRFGYTFRHEISAAHDQSRQKATRFRLVWPGGRAALSDGQHVLGRDPDLELFLDAQDVSRRLAQISVAGEHATIEDLGSKNGTFLANCRIASAAPLEDGAVIRVGSVQLTFSVVQSRGSTETALRKHTDVSS